jgi:carboxyl-terminal processing protease
MLHAQARAQPLTQQQYREDFETFWTTIKQNYAYLDKKKTDWEKVRTYYLPAADTISSRNSFVLLLEKVFYELYDHHASLNTNTMESQRLVPSGTDVWAEYRNGKPLVIEVRPGFGAAQSGLKPGMELVRFNDLPVETAIQPFMPKCLKNPDPEAKNYALRVMLAGNHINPRKMTVRDGKQLVDIFPDAAGSLLEHHDYTGLIESKLLNGGIGYIRINNCLGDNELIPLFDSVVTQYAGTKALILDMRETPGGGNTTVARAMLGRFITKEGFYQKHVLVSEETETGVKRSWVEIVSPRPSPYGKTLVVLANHWTGSVGEGIVIGFDALKRAVVAGTPMAGLNGANYSFTLPHSHIGFSFPSEKIFHVNGTPREVFQPTLPVDVRLQRKNEDLILKAAVDYINRLH